MKPYGRSTFLLNPKFQVITTWIWNGVGALVVMGIAAGLLPANIATDREALKARPDLALIPIITEIVAVGLLPMVFTLVSKDKVSRSSFNPSFAQARLPRTRTGGC